MSAAEAMRKIAVALEKAPRNGWTAELHIQVIKYAEYLRNINGREFCEGVGLQPAYGTEFLKMIKIADRLVEAGLDTDKI